MKQLPLILLALFNLFFSVSHAQQTGIQGRVVDAQSGESLPFVQVGFVGTTIGTVTDGDGRFKLVQKDLQPGHDSVLFKMLGYTPKVIAIRHGTMKRGVKIELNPHTNTLKPTEVTASRHRARYRRRNNPAVDLVRNVIANKERNRLASDTRFSRCTYEKEVLALDDFVHDFDRKWPWRRLKAIEKYIGRTPFDEVPALYISIRETKRTEQHGDNSRSLITARHLTGMNEMMGQDGMDSTFSAMFVPVDIYDNDIEIMLTHFTGPLHTLLATTFYHYYITDTLEYDGTPCVELSFAPANTSTYGFTGQMLVALDSSYAVVACVMTVSRTVNINYVHGLTIRQTFRRATERDSLFVKGNNDSANISTHQPINLSTPKYLPERSDIYGRIYVSRRLQELYFQQTTCHDDYRFGDSAVVLPDSLFKPLTSTAALPRKQLRAVKWDTIRSIPLTKGERGVDSMRHDIKQLPEIRFLKKFSLAVVTGHINTRSERDSSRFDIGPVYNFVSQNQHEGWRLRVGGMTTARLSRRNFIEGYAAYGFRDRRPKFSTTLIHTFDEKEHNSHENPMSLVSLKASYDLEVPGQKYEKLDRDNISSSNDLEYNMQYVAEAQLRLRKEFPSHLNVDTWLAARHYTPTSGLHYRRYHEDGSLTEVAHFAEAEWTARLAYYPYMVEDFGRPGNASLMRLKKDIPTIVLSHRIAYMSSDGFHLPGNGDGNGFLYQRTDLSAEKRFWLDIMGFADLSLKAGIIWNRVPLPRLIIPDGNIGIFLESSAFNTMYPMEFIVDRYVSLHATYHAKGLILNHVPLIRRLKLREVVGFNALYGTLSDKNNPFKANNAGLYQFPTGTQALGNTPYMEFSVGIENILRVLRIDYVRRLTYTDGLTPSQCGAIRFGVRLML